MDSEVLSRDGPGRTLFRQTWPMIFGVVAMLGFQLVDAAFIGQLGVRPLAALGFTVPVMQLIIGTQVGIGIATTALVSRAVGARDNAYARRLGALVVICGAGLMLLLCLLLWGFRGVLLPFLGADDSLMPLIEGYWIPWLCSAWLGAVLYMAYSVCRAHGDTRLPGLLMVLTSVVNLILDPIFIFVLGWGLPGAAIATIVAFVIGLALVIPMLIGRHWVSLEFGGIPVMPALRGLAAITGPAMVGQWLPGISAVLATILVAGFGDSAVGAWGLGTRLEFFSIVVVLGLTMSLPPLVGNCLGAGDHHGIRRVVRVALGFVLVWQVAIAMLWLAVSLPLSRLLTQDVAVAGIVRDYLLIVPLSYSGLGVCMLLVSVCNALGMPMRALLISTTRLFLFYLPMLWIGSTLGGLQGLFIGALIGNCGAGIGAYLMYRQALVRLGQPGARGDGNSDGGRRGGLGPSVRRVVGLE